MESFDLVVVGAGPGGYPAAIRAAQLGASVALVEQEELGGTCLNWGCIPTKTLIASSNFYFEMKNAAELGLRSDGVSFDYGELVARKDQVVKKLRAGVSQLLKANGVAVLKGTASFRSRQLLTVRENASEKLVEARKVILATGSVSARPDFLPVHPRVVDSKGFLNLTSLPSSAIVLGGGIIGCEFACMLAQFGVQTTLVELLPDIIATLDDDVRRELRRQMEKRLGIRIITGVSLEDIRADDSEVHARIGEEAIRADLLLAALGRRPATKGLALENAGLYPADGGFLKVDDFGRTRAASIFAVGDLTGSMQLAHLATSQGIVAAENACGQHLRRNEKTVPACIFTSPEIGVVGLSEKEAAQQGIEVRIGKFPFSVLGKALASGHATGFVKWIADPGTGQLLGAQAIGPHATELIAEAAVLVRGEATARDLAQTIHAHPTLSEAWMEAAHVLTGEPIHSAPPSRKTIRERV